MKLALCQLNFTIGAFEQNTSKILKVISDLQTKQVNVAVFSELAICGYPPLDLLEKDEFIENCQKSVEKIAAVCNNITVIIGSPSLNTGTSGKKLHNTAYVLSNGRIQSQHHKTLLPDYDVFNEYRFFEPATDWQTQEISGSHFAITICEDIWEEQPCPATQKKMYRDFPLEKLKAQHPDFIINLSASPFSVTHPEERRNILAKAAKKYNCPIVYVNQQGGNTDLVFDGGSMAMNNEGVIVKQLSMFTEEVAIFDTDIIQSTTNPQLPSHIAMIHNALVSGIRDYFTKSGFTKAVLGLSGGIDSAVTAVLACRALGSENVTGILMPSQYSSDHSVTDAEALAVNLGMKYFTLPIKDIYNSFENNLEPYFKDTASGIAEENIQARVRGTLLMSWSNKFGAIVLNTSNKSEMAVGYGTLYGDMCGAISVLGDVYKTKVYELAHYINKDKEVIPNNSIVKPPSAELRENQKDSDSLPEYDLLDSILENFIEQNKSKNQIIAEGFDAQVVTRVIGLVNNNEYKRYQAPPVIRVTSKAFGPGRRMPLVAKF